jgi:uncharacterized protein YdcH (DUF465 family)
MSISDTELRERLMQENAEFRKLAAEHQTCDQQLTELESRHYQNEEDKLLQKNLKKKKLALKDQMYAIMQEHRKGSAG